MLHHSVITYDIANESKQQKTNIVYDSLECKQTS